MCNPESVDNWYKTQLLNIVTLSEAIYWIQFNPKPSYWKGDVWSWAFWFMEKDLTLFYLAWSIQRVPGSKEMTLKKSTTGENI